MEKEAVLTSIAPNGYSVILPEYGLEGFIQLDPEDEKLHQNRLKALLQKDSEEIINVRSFFFFL